MGKAPREIIIATSAALALGLGTSATLAWAVDGEPAAGVEAVAGCGKSVSAGPDLGTALGCGLADVAAEARQAAAEVRRAALEGELRAAADGRGSAAATADAEDETDEDEAQGRGPAEEAARTESAPEGGGRAGGAKAAESPARNGASDESGAAPPAGDAAEERREPAPEKGSAAAAEPAEPSPPEDVPPAPSEGPAPPAGGTPAPRTLSVAGTAIPYRDVRGGTTPDTGAGLWLGSDATDDGSWGYFVGHNPGAFAAVKDLRPGDAVGLTDSAGASRTYTVREVFAVEVTATWKAIAGRVTGYGESVILQTCTGDGATNTIVVAA